MEYVYNSGGNQASSFKIVWVHSKRPIWIYEHQITLWIVGREVQLLSNGINNKFEGEESLSESLSS